MILKNLKQILNFKFIILTMLIFITVSTSAKHLLIELIESNYLNGDINNLSAFDIILSTFLFIEYEYKINDYLYILAIYTVPLLILSNFIYIQIIELSSYAIMRLKSYYKFIFNLVIVISAISVIYFTIGYVTIILFNIDKILNKTGVFITLFKNDFSYIDLILKSFIINNLMVILLVNFIIVMSIIINNFNNVVGIIIILFSMGVIGKVKFLPGYHAILFNTINFINLKVNDEVYIMYTLLGFITLISLIYILKFEKYRILSVDKE